MVGQGQSSAPGEGDTTSYGRACTNCFRVKCKCVYPPQGGACVRCLRLNKDCQPTVPVRRGRSAHSARSRTAKMEEKLDRLVSLMDSQGAPSSASSPSTAASASNAAQSHTGSGVGSGSHQRVSPSDKIHLPSTTSSTEDIPPPPAISYPQPEVSDSSLAAIVYNSTEIPLQQAQDALDFFRTKMLPHLPFMALPPSANPRQLQQDFPLLWLSIICLTSRSLHQKAHLGEAIRKLLSQRIVINQERSLHLLWACICFLGWLHHYAKDEPYISLWTQIAITIVYDLGLSKRPTYNPDHSPPRERTRAERRALLAVFILSCNAALNLETVSPMSWTPHMEESLRIVTEQPQLEGDRVLAAQVRYCMVVQQLVQAKDEDKTSSTWGLYSSALLAQLGDIRRNFQPEIDKYSVLALYLHGTELAIRRASNTQTLPPVSNPPDFQRLVSQQSTLTTTSEWLQLFFSEAETGFLTYPLPIFYQLERATDSLFQLTLSDNAAWDRQAARDTVDPLSILEKLTGHLDQLHLMVGSSDASSDLARAVSDLRAKQGEWEALAAKHFGQSGFDGEEVWQADMNAMVDDPWVTELLGTWESCPP